MKGIKRLNNNQLDIFEEINHVTEVGKKVHNFTLNGMGEPLPWEVEDYVKYQKEKSL